MGTPRGIRNNNPGNIRHGSKWQGLAPVQPDPDFCTFIAPEYGIRAMVKILLTYQRKHGICTINGLISRWAPQSENNTKAYIRAVAAECQIDPLTPIAVADHLPDLIPAIIKHECGQQPYSSSLIHQAIAMAME